MGARRPKEAFQLPADLQALDPALVSLACLQGCGSDWKSWTRELFELRYGGNVTNLLMTAREMSEHIGDEQAEQNLVDLRRDFARWLLQQQCDNAVGLAASAVQLYEDALNVCSDPAFTLALTRAGLNPAPHVYDEYKDTVLMRFMAQCHQPEQIGQLLEPVPPHERMGYVNKMNGRGMTALHFLAYDPEGSDTSLYYIQGMAHALAAQGADLHSEVSFDYGTGPTLGNIAHIAVAGGQIELTAELMALSRSLFAVAPDSRIKRTPYEIGCEMVEHLQLKAAAGKAWALVSGSTPLMVGSQGSLKLAAVAPHGGQFRQTALRDLKAATNLAAYALDKPLPYGDAAYVIGNLEPLTAPRALCIIPPQVRYIM